MEAVNCWDEKTVVEAVVMFIEFADVFSDTYHDFKGIPKEFGELTIELHPDAKLVRHRLYKMNPKI